MDILDQISNNKNTNSVKKLNRSSTLSHQFPIKNVVQDKLSTLYEKQTFFKSKIDQRTSYQQLRSPHFQLPTANYISRLTQSHKDPFNFPDKQNKILGDFNPSLAVIASEESSNTTKDLINVTVSQRMQRKQLNNKTSNPIQNTQLLYKIKVLEQQKSKLQLKNVQITNNLFQKTTKIKELQQKLIHQQNRYKQNYMKMLHQQTQIFKSQIQNINKSKQQELLRRQSLLKWQSQKKQQLFKHQIEAMKNMIENYKSMIKVESGNKIDRNILQLKQLGETQKIKLDSQKNIKQQKQLQKKRVSLQYQIQQFYKQKKCFIQQCSLNKKQLDEQKIKFNNERISFMKQKRQQQQKFNNQFYQKMKIYEQKLHKLQIQTYELDLKKKLIQKQAQEMKRLNQKIINESKIKLKSLNQEKQRVFKFQQELIQKIKIVELYYQNYSSQSTNNQNFYTKQHSGIKQQIQKSQINQPLNQVIKQKISEIPEKSLKIPDQRKVDLQNYLANLRKSNIQAKSGLRPIYKLQNMYK